MGKSDIQSIDQTQVSFNNFFGRISFFKQIYVIQSNIAHTCNYTCMKFCILYTQLCIPMCTEWLVAVQQSDMIKRDENTKFWKRVPLKQL